MMEKLLGSILQEKNEINREKYLKYFALDYKINNSMITFFTTIKGTSRQIARYDYDALSKEEQSYCAVCGYHKCEHVTFLVQEVMKEKEKEVSDQVSNYIEEEVMKKKRLEQANFVSSLNKISLLIDKEEKYSDKNKINLEVYFDNAKHQIYFKIGNEKMYRITSLAKFIASFKMNYEYPVSKDFQVVLGEELFSERELQLIDFIDNSIKDAPNIYLDEENVYKVLSLSRGHYVYIDEERYDVDYNCTVPHVAVSEEGLMKIITDEDFVFMNDYLISYSKKIIRLIKNDVSWKHFLKLASSNGNISVLDVLDDFKYSVFIKYMSLFDIDKKISSSFRFEQIKIKSYFDLENDTITLKTKILRNDSVIEVDTLDRLSSRQYEKYVSILKEYGFEKNVISDENKILDFLQSDFHTLKNVSEVYLSEEIKKKQVVKFSSPGVSIRYNNGMMESLMESSSFSEQELNQIYLAIRKKKNYVLLEDDRIITLDNDEAEKFENIVDDFSLDAEYLKSRQDIPLYQVFKAYAYEDIELDDYLDNLLKEIVSFKKNKMEVPAMKVELRPYQQEGYKWLSILLNNNLGGILADDMGLGKTLQMITLITSLKTEKNVLIVTPKSLIYNWMKEFEKFSSLEVKPVFGLQNERKEIIDSIISNKKTIYITSYDSLRSDIEFYDDKNFSLCVLDEGQYIKNVTAKKTKSVKLIHADHRFVLTGTPIENNIIDLWSLFDFIMPGYLPPLDEFRKAYEFDNEYVHIVHKKVAPFILRRTKKEVLKDLPAKFEMVVTVEMNESQKKIYDTYRLKARELLSSDSGQIEILALLTRLRQICVDPSLFIDNYSDGSSKMDYLFEMIETYINNGHRLVVFSQFVRALNIIEDYLNSKGIAYYSITGDTKAKDRVEICDEFNSSDEVPLCLVSLKAGGTGLNLIGADSVIHLDPWWNEAVINQATDRTYRIGQKKNVNVVKLICENSIEQKVLELQSMKKDLIDKLISDSDKSITSLSKEDIKYILDK